MRSSKPTNRAIPEGQPGTLCPLTFLLLSGSSRVRIALALTRHQASGHWKRGYVATELRLIKSREELHSLIPTLIEALNKDFQLALGAAANPFLALEELGYRVDEKIRPAVERRLRFPPATAEKLDELALKIYRLARRTFPLEDADELHRVLFEELKLPRPAAAGVKLTAPLAYHAGRAKPVEDPLEALRGAHPIMEPLLEYRRLEATAPRFAPRELYLRLRRGETWHPISRLQARLHKADKR